MANTLITPTWVLKDAGVNFKNQIKLLGQFDRSYDDAWKNKPGGAKIGYTVQARLAQRFTVSEGQALQVQAITNQTVPITINHQYHTDMGWSSADDSLVMEEVQARYTVPAGLALASKWGLTAGLETYKSIPMTVGTPGTPITDNDTYLQGVARLANLGIPEPYVAVLDPKAMAKIVNANFAIFNLPGGNRNFREGQFSGNNLGIEEWYQDSLMPTHTTGTFTTATPIVSSASQTGSTLAMSGLGTYAMKQGDTFTVANVYSVNRLGYNNTNDLQEFVLTSDLSGTTTGTFNIYPPIITSGPLQTVTVSPANSAVVTWKGATGTVSATMAATVSRQSIIMNQSACAFVMADLPSNLAGAMAKRISSQSAGIAMRFVEQYNIQTDQAPSRIDTIGGVAVVLPDFAFRAWS